MKAVAHPKNSPIAGNMDTSFLKILALLFMTVDHIGAALLPGMPELRIIGRMAFPLYAWCLVVGSEKTHSPLHYGLRLFVVGLISQPLYMMALSHGWADLNILFSLLVGLVALVGIQKRWMGSQFWAPILCYILLGFIRVDYGWMGLTFILVLYGARKTRSGLATAFLAYAMFWGVSSSSVTQLFGWPIPLLEWPGIRPIAMALLKTQSMVWLSLPLIVLSTRSNIKIPTWLSYALYPLHLVILILLRIFLKGVSLPSLFGVF